jgi:hypothetical protein
LFCIAFKPALTSILSLRERRQDKKIALSHKDRKQD